MDFTEYAAIDAKMQVIQVIAIVTNILLTLAVFVTVVYHTGVMP